MSEKVLYFQGFSELSFYTVWSFVTPFYSFCSPNVPQILNENTVAVGKLWLDNPCMVAIMEIKRALRHAVSSSRLDF